MSKKKKRKTSPKKKKSIKKTKCSNKEKVCGEPQPVTEQPYKPPTLSYDQNGEVYPKLIFLPDSWWTRFKRFLGLIP